MPVVALLLPLALLTAPAPAEDASTDAPPNAAADAIVDGDSIVIPVAVYGNDACPKASADEIIVCARHPESDRYRVPAPLREQPKGAGDTAWAVQVEGMQDDARYLIPGSCTVVGPSGSTGCTHQMIRQWFRERRSTGDN